MASFPENEIEILPDYFTGLGKLLFHLNEAIAPSPIQNLPINASAIRVNFARRQLVGFMNNPTVKGFGRAFDEESGIHG